MSNFISLVKDSIGDMRYGTSMQKAQYWFIKIGAIVVAVLLVAIVAGLIYCKVNGIEISLPF